MNKVELDNNKGDLKLLLNEINDKTIDYEAQISKIDQELEDLGKPETTPEFLDKIYETIQETIEQLDFDSDCIEYEMEMDYNNTVTLNDVNIKDPSDMTEKIYEEVVQLFAEIIETK